MKGTGQKKKKIGINKTSIVKTEEFSQVSEEGSRVMSEANESEDELGWEYFHQSKLEVQGIVQELLPKYQEYRKVLFDALKEICHEGSIPNFDYARLAPQHTSQELRAEQKEPLPLGEKLGLVEKVISERRIKKYYKDKHEVNFRDELDPEDDQREIYKFYQEALFQTQPPPQPQPQQYQPYEQYLAPPSRPQQPLEIENKVLEVSNQYQAQLDQSFQRMKRESQEPKIKVSFSKMKEPLGGMGQEHELSFDVKNEPYFINQTSNRINTESFGWHDEEDRHELVSELNFHFGSERTRKAIKSEKSPEGSQTDNLYRNFIEKQHEELSRQKQRVQELTEKTEKVLNNEVEFEDHQDQQDTLSQLRYVLGEIVEIFAVEEGLKFSLKFRSYELLTLLYQHASLYYGEEIAVEEPLQLRHLSQIVRAALPEEPEEGVSVVALSIFGDSASITYEQFLDRLTPSINSREFELLESSSYSGNTSKTLDLTIRLFNVWIEMDYFERQLKGILQAHSDLADRFIEECTESTMVVPQLVAEFLTKNKKFPKSRKLKCEIFLRKVLGGRLTVSEFYRWVDSKARLNQTLEKLQDNDQYDYYHLY